MSNVPTIKTSSKALPRLGFGTWQTQPPKTVEDVMYDAIKYGYRHIDCAAVYGNEKYVGNAIKKAIEDKLVIRKELWITSKVWNTNHAKKHVREACLRTLKDLGLDYLDLYLIHFPMSFKYVEPDIMYPPIIFNNPDNPDLIEFENTPLQETWRAMEELVDNKLVMHIGVSNFDFQLLQDLLKYCKIKPLTNQIELHPYLQQKRMVKFCKSLGILVTAYSPFGGKSYIDFGLASKDELHVLDHPALKQIAINHKKTVAQIVLRWVLQLADNIVVLTKTATPERAKENFDIFDFELSEQDMSVILQLDCNRRYNDFAVVSENKTPYWPIFA